MGARKAIVAKGRLSQIVRLTNGLTRSLLKHGLLKERCPPIYAERQTKAALARMFRSR